MRIGNPTTVDVQSKPNLANELLKNKVDKKDDDKEKSPGEIVANLKLKNLKQLLKGKSGVLLAELNKQKVTPEKLKESLDKLKNDDDKKETKVDTPDKKDDKKPELIDPKDKNKDGKVSAAEKKEADKKTENIDPKDKNRDGKVSPEELKEAKKKKALNLVKDLVQEVKKDNDLKDVKPQDLKNVSKMLNNEILDKNEAAKVNKFLDN